METLVEPFEVETDEELERPAQCRVAVQFPHKKACMVLQIIIEPTDVLLKRGVSVARSISTLENSIIPIQILNSTDKSITIPAHYPIAICTCLPAAKSIMSLGSFDFHPQSLVPEQLGISYHAQQLFLDMGIDALDLTAEEKQAVTKYALEYLDIFAKDHNDVGRTHLVQHQIVTREANSLKQRPHRLPYKDLDTLEKEVN